MHEGNPQIIKTKGHINIFYSITKCKCQSEHRNKIKPSTLCPLQCPAHARRQIKNSHALIYNSDRFLWSRISCLNLCHIWNLCHLPINRRSSSNKHLEEVLFSFRGVSPWVQSCVVWTIDGIVSCDGNTWKRQQRGKRTTELKF